MSVDFVSVFFLERGGEWATAAKLIGYRHLGLSLEFEYELYVGKILWGEQGIPCLNAEVAQIVEVFLEID